MSTTNILQLRHPDHEACEWELWRLTYAGGRDFVEKYLERFSSREDDGDFKTRKRLSPCPAFAKAAINDIKNAIFQRIPDVSREDGPTSYQDAIRGLGYGVDRRGSSMNSFIGREILPELLPMKRVGVYVDRQPVPVGATIKDELPAPYIYIYRAEDILSWRPLPGGAPWELQSVLLREWSFDEGLYGLPDSGIRESARLIYLNEQGTVSVKLFDGTGKETSHQDLDIETVPFHMFELNDSLLRDAADYQVALLNLNSADIAYCLKANFPFYTEQSNPTDSSAHLKRSQAAAERLIAAANPASAATGEPATAEETDTDDEKRVGAHHGRTYPRGTERPGFIAPPTEPLQASMAKQQQLKDEIRLLVNLALSNVKPKMESAESKTMDERGLEAGLSYIGLVLEQGERQIAKLWAMYEGEKTPATVKYPDRYSLKSDSEILDETEKLEERMMASPSDAYRREVAKRIIDIMFGSRLPVERVRKMMAEVDNAEILITDPDTVQMLVENAILDNKGAAQAFSIPLDRVEQAKKDHADRAARIAEAQAKSSGMAARGVPDLDSNTGSGRAERSAATEGQKTSTTRGAEK